MRISDWSSDVCSSDLIPGTRVDMQFLYRQEIALTTIMFMEIWNWTPFSFIIMLAGLVSLPREPQEAAQILGASRWHIFWEVQVPLLRPVILLALILRFLESMAEFPKTWALLQGGTGSATETAPRSEEHTSELQSLIRLSYAVF